MNARLVFKNTIGFLAGTLLVFQTTHAQINYTQAFTGCNAAACNGWTVAGGLTPLITSTAGSNYTPCATGNPASKVRLTSANPTATLTATTSLGTSTGIPVSFGFSTKSIRFSNGNSPNNLMSVISVEWSPTGAAPWTAVGTSFGGGGNVNCSGSPVFTFTPPNGQSVFMRINMALGSTALDHWVVIDDIYMSPYCSPTYSNNIEPICNVTFAGINNTSSGTLNGTPAVENFTAVFGSVTANNSYLISVTGNTDGPFTNYFTAFFDWDRNGSLETAVQIGSITNDNCGATASTTVSVPITALGGITRMRIVKDYSATAGVFPTDPCGAYDYGQTEDYSLNVTAAVQCGGTPNAGSIATPVSACPGGTVVLTASGLSNEVNITYQWEESPNGTSGWGSVSGGSGATTASYTTTAVNTTRYFRIRSNCSNGGGTNTSNVVTVVPALNPACYCAGVLPSSNVQATGIANVTFNTINNSTTGASGYNDFTGQQTTLMIGGTYPLSVTATVAGSGQTGEAKAWIDWDHSATFDLSEEYALGTVPGLSTALTTNSPLPITVPATATLGTTMMRVRVTRLNVGSPLACGQQNQSEAEDYTIVVNPCTPPAATYSIVSEDCGAAAGSQVFSVQANVTSYGSGTSGVLTYTVDYGAPIVVPVTGGLPQNVTVGPFPITKIVNLSFSSDIAACGAVTYTAFSTCEVKIDCGTTTTVTHCYRNFDTRTFTYTNTSLSGEAMAITFLSGCLDPTDVIGFYEGTDNSFPIQFVSGQTDLSGIVVQSTGQSIFIEITSNGSNSCADGGQSCPWVFEVECVAGCQEPNGTVGTTNCTQTDFSLVVDVTNTGDGATTTLWYSVDGGTPTTVPGLDANSPLQTIGPFPIASSVQVKLLHESDGVCDKNLGTFTNSLCPPLNDLCANATIIQVNTPAQCPAQATTGRTSLAGTEIAAPSCGGAGPFQDVWYQFNTGSSVSPLNIAITAGTITNYGVQIFPSCGGVPISCTAGSPAVVSLPGLPTLTDYWIRVFTNTSLGTPGTFSICVNANQPATACGTQVSDPGGPSTNYPNNSDVTTTLCTTAGGILTMTFTQFATEDGFDYLEVYDGPDTSSPLVGTFTGTTIPGPISSTNPSGCLTTHFVSDGSIRAAGYRANITCCTGPAPTATPTSNSVVCAGSTLQLNVATNTGTLFSWTGPNSFTSAAQNPPIANATTAATGTYTVTVRNGASGCPTSASTYAVVGPTVSVPVVTPASATICSGTPQGLSASATSAPYQQTTPNGSAITINDSGNGTPYPNTIAVSGYPTTGVTVANVRINGFSHTYTEDVDILLRSPSGVNVIIMSDRGGANSISNRNFVFQDGSPQMGTGTLASGTYSCSNTDTGDDWPAPGPGVVNTTGPLLSTFTGDVNGTWSLYVYDDVGGDSGIITSWSITFSVVPVVSYAWTPSGGSMVPANGLASAVTVSPTSTQSYTVTVGHNANACTRQVIVPVSVTPTPDAGSDGALVICHNAAPVALSPLLGGTPDGGGSWSGPNGAHSGTYDPTLDPPGNYVYTVSAAPCADASATIAVSYDVTDTDGDLIIDCDDSCPNFPGQNGDFCDADAGSGYTLGQITACACAPVACTTDLNLIFTTDGVTNIGWELRQQGSDVLVQAGGGVYAAAPEYGISTCLPDGDFYLVVTSDQVGGGIVQGGVLGGYRLETDGGVRLIDNTNNFLSGAVSVIAGNDGFSLPAGTDRLIYTSCDKMDWRTGEYIVANDNANVATYYGGANAAQTGYEMWFYNPNGGYSFRRFHSHATSDGFAPANAARACHIKINNWAAVNHLPSQTLLNVKVRGRIMQAGLPFNLPWGPACRFKFDPTRAECPLTHLMDVPGSVQLSCGGTRAIGSGSANLVHARPVNRFLGGVSSPANKYQFRFRIPAEFVDFTKTSNTSQYWVNTVGLAPCKSYWVEVRASFDNGLTYCNTYAAANPYSPLWGRTCIFNTACSVDGGGQNMAIGGSTGSPRQLLLYPNPNNGEQLFLSIDQVREGVEKVNVDIYDTFGKRVSARTIAVADGYVNAALELNGELAAGMYVVNITAGGDTYTERLVIQP